MKVPVFPFAILGRWCVALLLLGWPLWGQGQTCQGQPGYHLVTEYGAFTPDLSDKATINRNNATLNLAIRQVGQAGGGIVGLPAGTFYIGPDPDGPGRHD
ncbi:hypothetical protein [Hymenobacter terrenus]|uniref:hypothetical protein n=1 Tax=Hymenobacter terrenus TaxID=1629124 RepID=UPI0006193D68|nr:hypothetical protein [Hymenobacter terrenus]